jgi:hypothetical protein
MLMRPLSTQQSKGGLSQIDPESKAFARQFAAPPAPPIIKRRRNSTGVRPAFLWKAIAPSFADQFKSAE